MKRLTVTELEPGLLRVEVRDGQTGHVNVLSGRRFSEAEVLAFIRGMAGFEPDEAQVATIRRVLGKREGA